MNRGYLLSIALRIFGIFATQASEARRETYVLLFTKQPSNVFGAEGSSITFNCTASSFSQPVTYRWLLNDTEVSINSGYKYFLEGYHGNLVVRNLTRHIDDGVFRCIASNRYGSILSTKGTLKVAYFEILQPPKQINLKQKLFQSLTIPATKVRSFPAPQITWQRTRDDRYIDDGYSGHLFISPNGDLSIVIVQKSENYRIVVSNPYAGKNVSVTVSLDVKGRADISDMYFLKRPQDITVELGQTRVVFECIMALGIAQRVGGIRPVAPTFIWYKDGVEVSPVINTSKYGYLKNSSSIQEKLIVYSPQQSDQGVYKCRVSDLKTALEATANLTVINTTDPAPVFNSKLSPTLDKLPGEDIKIECPEVDRGDIIWYKNSVAIKSLNNKRINVSADGDLLITNVSVTDTGLFQVFARTDGGENSVRPTYLEVGEHAETTATTKMRPTITNTTPTPSPNPTTSFNITTPKNTTPTIIEPTHSTSTDRNGTWTEPGTALTSGKTTHGGEVVGTTLGGTGAFTTEMVKQEKKLNTDNNGLKLWIYPSAGAIAVVALITVVYYIYCCKKRKRHRSQSIKLKSEGDVYEELEMSYRQRKETSRGECASGVDKRSPKSKSKLESDTNLLLNDAEALYAPVQALDRMTGQANGRIRSAVGNPTHAPSNLDHEYDEPIKKRPRKPYLAPLPTIPTEARVKPRPPSSFFYLELLGPDQQAGEVYAEPREGKVNVAFTKSGDEDVYDSAHEGVVTETFRKLTKLSRAKSEVKNGLPDQNGACAGDVLQRYINPEEMRAQKGELAGSRNSSSEPLYHVLESPQTLNDEGYDERNFQYGEGIYDYDMVEERLRTRHESLYQPLLVHTNKSNGSELSSGINGFNDDDDNVYQPLDKKVRSASEPGAVILRKAKEGSRNSDKDGKRNYANNASRNSRALTDPQRLSGASDNDDIYQPLNNSERCPLNVSKPMNSFGPTGEGKRLSLSPEEEGDEQPSPSPSINEPNLHAVNVSPSGSLKESNSTGTKDNQGHRHNHSDATHSIVNIANPSRRRASTTALAQSIPRFHRRNLSDAGLCAVDLSQLHMVIDVERDSTIQNGGEGQDDGNNIYMPLIKTIDNAGIRDSVYAPLERNQNFHGDKENRDNLHFSLQRGEDRENQSRENEANLYQEIAK